MKSRQIFFLFILYSTLSLNTGLSQNLSYGISANLGFSQVTAIFPTSDKFFDKHAVSGNYGAFIEKKIGDKSSLGAKLLWVQIEGKEKRNGHILTIFDGQQIVEAGSLSDKSRLHSSYMALPIYYKFAIRKFAIRGGVQTMFFLFASSEYESDGILFGEPFHNEGKTENIKFDRFDFGPKFGIDYKIAKNFRLNIDYYHGIADITTKEFPFERKNRQATLGVQYIFAALKTDTRSPDE